MNKMLLIITLILCMAGTARALNAQQEKMKDCNAQASQKGLKGDQRKEFMSTCLGAGAQPQTKQLTAQQQKMKDCNAQAGKQQLTGDKRKQFMSSCLSAK